VPLPQSQRRLENTYGVRQTRPRTKLAGAGRGLNHAVVKLGLKRIQQ
jgi:hypothetical protein